MRQRVALVGEQLERIDVHRLFPRNPPQLLDEGAIAGNAHDGTIQGKT